MSAGAIVVVTGASGVGKSAALAALEARAVRGLRCFYFDSIGVPPAEVIEREFGGGERWQAHATEQWLQRLSAESAENMVSVLEGSTRPSFVRAALARVPHARVQIVLLDCQSAVRAARLVARGQPELANPQMDSWAAYLRGQADALELPVIDTTHHSVAEVAEGLRVVAERVRST